MKTLFKFLFCMKVAFWLQTCVVLAQGHQIKVVEDDDSSTPLYGAAIYFPALENGLTSSITGVFNIPDHVSGSHEVKVTYLGYEPQTLRLNFPLAESVIIRMKSSTTELQDVVVQGEGISDFKRENLTSTIDLTEMNLKQVPKLAGEPDLIRIIQNLPGVKVESDFSSGFNVRGGRNDQNLILLEGVPMYNPWHLFGIFSAFNSEAVKSVELSKGIFPAQYGGRLSSVLDIELEDGYDRDGGGYLTVTPFSGSFSYGKPINQKTSVLFATRRSYVDPLLWGISAATFSEDEYSKSQSFFHYNFTDFNAKVTHRFNPNQKLELGYFYGVDRLKFTQRSENKSFHPKEANHIVKDRADFGWQNHTINARYFYNNGAFSMSSQFYVTRFRTLNRFKVSEDNGYYFYLESLASSNIVMRRGSEDEKFEQRLNDLGANQDFGLELSENVNVHMGLQWQFHDFYELNSYQQVAYGTDEVSMLNDEFGSYGVYGPLELVYNFQDKDDSKQIAHELSAYGRMSVKLNALSLFPGIRYHYFTNGGYGHLLPRLNANLQVTSKINLTAGYGHFTQYYQTVGLDFIRVPVERWFWSNDDRPPALARSYTFGIGLDLGQLGSLSVESYYKDMDGLLNFSIRAQSQAFDNGEIPQFPNETISGSGSAYGTEFFWNKTEGKVTGWVGYTLSWAWNQFEEINDNDPFPARTDKRHDIQTYWNWDFRENWSIGLLFNYKSGQPITFSTGYYFDDTDPLGLDNSYRPRNSSQVILERNNHRLPDYHRLDLSITWKNRRIFKHRSEVSLNVINVYNHINTLTVSGRSSHTILPNGGARIYPNNRYYGQLPLLPVLSVKIGLGKKYKWEK